MEDCKALASTWWTMHNPMCPSDRGLGARYKKPPKWHHAEVSDNRCGSENATPTSDEHLN